MANIYQVDPALNLFVDAWLGNTHSGYVEVADPPSAPERQRLSRDLGPAASLVNTSLVVAARAIVRNAKRVVLTVDVYQRDAAGAAINKQTFSDSRPSTGNKQKNLNVDVEIF
jgi:hypothetical protein